MREKSKKTLRSVYNKFPQFYKECCLIELALDVPTQKRWTKMRKQMLPEENDFTVLLEDDNKTFDLIVKNPKILERPIVLDRNKAIIARPPELLNDFLLIL